MAATSLPILAFALLFQVLTPSQRADARLGELPHVTVRFYDIPGRTEGDIMANLMALRPVDPAGSGERYDSVTRTRLQVRWRRSSADAACRPLDIRVDYQTIVTMPRLADESHLNRANRSAWARYMASLTYHERGHVEITSAHVERLIPRLEAASCEAMPGMVERARRQIDRAQESYDRITDHGRTQGLSFAWAEPEEEQDDTAEPAVPVQRQQRRE